MWRLRLLLTSHSADPGQSRAVHFGISLVTRGDPPCSAYVCAVTAAAAEHKGSAIRVRQRDLSQGREAGISAFAIHCPVCDAVDEGTFTAPTPRCDRVAQRFGSLQQTQAHHLGPSDPLYLTRPSELQVCGSSARDLACEAITRLFETCRSKESVRVRDVTVAHDLNELASFFGQNSFSLCQQSRAQPLPAMPFIHKQHCYSTYRSSLEGGNHYPSNAANERAELGYLQASSCFTKRRKIGRGTVLG